MARTGYTPRIHRGGRANASAPTRYVARGSNRVFVVFLLFAAIAALFFVKLVYL